MATTRNPPPSHLAANDNGRKLGAPPTEVLLAIAGFDPDAILYDVEEGGFGREVDQYGELVGDGGFGRRVNEYGDII